MGSLSIHRRAVVPPGVKLLRSLVNREPDYDAYRTSVLILTFIAYTLYHVSRKPPSIVKNVLVSSYKPWNSVGDLENAMISLPWPLYKIFINRVQEIDTGINNSIALGNKVISVGQPDEFQGWAPFDGDSGAALLGQMDLSFLGSYAVGMYFAGPLADRLSLRFFLAIGMTGTGLLVSLFGMAYWWNIHRFAYFLSVQAVAGLFQATGWPSVVAVVGNWFGKRKRGLIMGLWNAHTSVGNIVGSLIASDELHGGWGWSFLVPGFSIVGGGLLVFLFLVEDPAIVGLTLPHRTESIIDGGERVNGREGLKNENARKTEKLPVSSMHTAVEPILPLLRDEESDLKAEKGFAGPEQRIQAIGFRQACAIPGLIPFAFCLFFAKLVAYTFLYWLPFYIEHTGNSPGILLAPHACRFFEVRNEVLCRLKESLGFIHLLCFITAVGLSLMRSQFMLISFFQGDLDYLAWWVYNACHYGDYSFLGEVCLA
eukprot:c28911_g1_i1 orf=1064-2512(-)